MLLEHLQSKGAIRIEPAFRKIFASTYSKEWGCVKNWATFQKIKHHKDLGKNAFYKKNAPKLMFINEK